MAGRIDTGMRKIREFVMSHSAYSEQDLFRKNHLEFFEIFWDIEAQEQKKET